MLDKSSMNIMAFIPARIGSTRLKDKPLQKIKGTPLIKFVAEKVLKTDLFSSVVVATDSEKIQDLFTDGQIQCILTHPNHQSGTDRIFEALSQLTTKPDGILNIQGDEPFIYKSDLLRVMEGLEQGYKMVSLYESLDPQDLDNLNRVKVILNEQQEAIYFSRLAIPFSRGEKDIQESKLGKHVGIYGYETHFLKEFCEQGVSFLERAEMLEQLRALEMGVKIKMFSTKNIYKGVDVAEDLQAVEKLLNDGDVSIYG